MKFLTTFDQNTIAFNHLNKYFYQLFMLFSS